MVGRNDCLYCMYNEFDIINNFMVNFNQIDLCSTSNLDLTEKYYTIDNAYIRTGHKVLLTNQTNPIENDIYKVDSRGYLILSDELSDTGKTWRYKAYIKLGNNKTKQFHLINSGETFPTTTEPKYWLSGHAYIIKNLFNYDLNSTNSILPKIVFADYELARISVNRNYDLYDGFTLPEGITNVNISYHGGEYPITVDNDTSKFITSDITSETTIYNDTLLYSGETLGNQTHVKVSADFLSNATIYDYVKLEISGESNSTLYSFIKQSGATYIVLSDYIPDNVLNDYFTGTTSTYTLTNLQWSTQATIHATMMESFYAKYFTIIDSVLTPIENISNKYFDYDGIVFNISGATTGSYSFTTQNHYVSYKLYEHLNKLYSGFTEAYEFLPSFTLTGFTTDYYDLRPNPAIYPHNFGDENGTLVKITPSNPNDLINFRKNTFINIVDGVDKYRTLIVDLIPNEYLVIETYKNKIYSGITISEIETIYDLGTISDILYDIFLNDDALLDYYRVRDDDVRRNIFNAYATFISENTDIITYSTAFLLQDEQHKFILKIYNPENLTNGGIATAPTVSTGIAITGSTTSIISGSTVLTSGDTVITERGIQYYNENFNVSVKHASSTIGSFDITLTGLTLNTNYFYRAYAVNEETIGYGETLNFQTGVGVTPTVITSSNVSVNGATATITDNQVVSSGSTTLTKRGVRFYSVDVNFNMSPIDDVFVSPAVGFFNIDITNILTQRTYYYTAYATNEEGTGYGQQLTFQT